MSYYPDFLGTNLCCILLFVDSSDPVLSDLLGGIKASCLLLAPLSFSSDDALLSDGGSNRSPKSSLVFSPKLCCDGLESVVGGTNLLPMVSSTDLEDEEDDDEKDVDRSLLERCRRLDDDFFLSFPRLLLCLLRF